MVVKTIPTEKIFNFYENLKAELLGRYKKKLKTHLDIMLGIHKLIDSNAKEFDSKCKKKLNQQIEHFRFTRSHQQIDRSTLIESVIILDSSINQSLHNFQLRKLNKKPEEIKEYSKVEDGLNKYLKELVIPLQFEKKRSIIKHFRVLRNQFAHYPIGMFFFSAEQGNFESFLKSIEGIDFKNSYWIDINGKAGVAIPYNINSNKFIEKFSTDSIIFFSMLVEILFPTKKKKVFNFEK